MSRAQGSQAEQQVCQWLERQGLILLHQNFHCRFGELDLVMQQDNELVFIEVKYRRSSGFGGASAAVTPAKQKRLRLAASYYLQQQGWSDRPCRCDVVSVQGQTIDWIKNAF
ncbi:YraN family protein [Ferrimonas aestuarii]|uniref:UPF0102 protein FCL42_18385 n=1 Tax=Ferrimonas aestuarii TaxID=2569539 RepID=A0A4U1BI32_9GAMM|nr:YraN family protein [Ferrimonas aestuarii]TKB50963.1 YraN family protein [Ferrimonas aestuarii]